MDINFQSGFRFTANLKENTENPHIPLLPHMHSLPRYHNPHQSGTFVVIDKPTLMQHYCPQPRVTLWFTLGVHSMCANKYIMTSIHHYYSIMQNNFTALKLLCVLPVLPSLFPLAPGKYFTIFIVSLFFSPECLIVGIIQLVTHSDKLLLLSNTY